MPQNLVIGAFGFGAILLVLGLVGGGFKLFGAEIPAGVSSISRKIAFGFGIVFVGGSLAVGLDIFSWQKARPPQSAPAAAPEKIVAANIYVHPSGSFERQGEVWVEYPPYASGKNFRFKEARRDSDYIYLSDETRHKENDPVRILYLRIPISGGMVQWSYPNPFEWQDLYPVSRKL
jgi:hypothetical protein